MKVLACLMFLAAVAYAKKKTPDYENQTYTVTDVATLTYEVKDWDDEGDTLTGEVKIGLFGEITPMTVLNFKGICKGFKRPGSSRLAYKNTYCHRLVKDMLVQCGDVINNDGTGSRSIFGERFVDENFKVSHGAPGIVSMANHGKDTNGSQFFILFTRSRYLDGNHVAFGKVLDGQDVLESMNKMGTLEKVAVPKHKVKIIGCEVEELDNKYDLSHELLMADDITKAK